LFVEVTILSASREGQTVLLNIFVVGKVSGRITATNGANNLNVTLRIKKMKKKIEN
jgi:hypothetical protein